MDPRGLSAAAQCPLRQACGAPREGLRGRRCRAPERDPVHRGAARGGPRQYDRLQRLEAAAAGEPHARPLRQGTREGARISGRQPGRLARAALPLPLRSSGPRDRRPDPVELGRVLDAVKAWPGNAGVCCTHSATASLDRVSTRGQGPTMGRDEETGFQVEQRNSTWSYLALTEETAPWVVPLSPGCRNQSGQLMCYENRTTPKATDITPVRQNARPAATFCSRPKDRRSGRSLAGKCRPRR